MFAQKQSVIRVEDLYVLGWRFDLALHYWPPANSRDRPVAAVHPFHFRVSRPITCLGWKI